jgi:GcrA cell cycle regulator
MAATRFHWTEDNVAQLKELYSQQVTFEQIGQALFGFADAKNAVAGKAFRLGLTLPSGIKRVIKQYPRASRAKSSSKQGSIATKALRAEGLMVFDGALRKIELNPPLSKFNCTIMELGEDSCRAPIGDPQSADFRFCGAPFAKLPGPYCAFCHGRIYGYAPPVVEHVAA